jgi:hypothetical protein
VGGSTGGAGALGLIVVMSSGELVILASRSLVSGSRSNETLVKTGEELEGL